MAWPNSKKTFTQLVDGTTKVEGVNCNVVYDEEEAIQTFIGAAGNAQAKLAASNNLFRYQFSELPQVTWIDSDTIEIEGKTIQMFSTNNYVIKRTTSAFQITLSADLDTGAEAADTWYYIWLTGDAANSTYSAVLSVSSSSPTGYTYYKLIGAVKNDAGSNIIPFYQHGNRIVWKRAIGFACGTSTSWAEVSVITACPACCDCADFDVYVSDTCGAALRHADCDDDYPAQLVNCNSSIWRFLWASNVPIRAGGTHARAIDYKLSVGYTAHGYLKSYTLKL